MPKTEFRVGSIAAVSSLLILLGAPSLSTGADPCAPGSRLAATASCLGGTSSSSSSQPSSLRAYSSATPRAVTDDAAVNPPLHGTDPHGQGTVAVIDTNPDPTRPYSSSTTGNGEDIIVGRSRGEQRPDGTYHGHITVAALFGNEIVGVDTNPGETKAGPLDGAQVALLDALCDGSGNEICLEAVTVDSTTTETGSTNRFSAANVRLGCGTPAPGPCPDGISAGAAESNGNISDDGTCQTSHGDSSVADVTIGGMAAASVAKSSTDSTACNDGTAPTQTNTSSVIALGGSGVPLPNPGCDDGTPDTVVMPDTRPLLTIVCNADDTNGTQAGAPYGVREALAAFIGLSGGTAAVKQTTAASESRAVAPAPTRKPQCSDGIDNDGDGKIDFPNDPGCDSLQDDDETNGPGTGPGTTQCSDGIDNDGDGKIDFPNDPGCVNAADDDESNRGGGGGGTTECSDENDNDGDGRIDASDPGCHTDGDASNPDSFDPSDDDESNGGGGGGTGSSVCSDGADNDGDGVSDADDPGCHSDGNANNPASYVPGDDSELNGGVAGETASAPASLPMTGTDIIGAALLGALLLAAGLVLRRAPRRGVSR